MRRSNFLPQPGDFEGFLPGLQVRLGSPLAFSSGRTPPVLPKKHFEQIANPPLLDLLGERMTQG